MTQGEIYAWVEVEPDGREGVILATIPDIGISGPLQHRDRAIAEKFRHIAATHCERTGKPVRLVRFLRTETLEEL